VDRLLGKDSITRQNQLMRESLARLIGNDSLSTRKAIESLSQRLNETIMGSYGHNLVSATESLTKQFAAINAQLTHGFQFPTPVESLSAVARQITELGRINFTPFTAVGAAEEALKRISEQHRNLSATLVSSLTRVPTEDALGSLALSFNTQLKAIQDSQSALAPLFTERLQAAFEAFEDENEQRLAQTENNIGQTIDSLESRLTEPAWSSQLKRLAALAALASLLLSLLLYLDKKEQSQKQDETARKIVLLMEAIAKHTAATMTRPYVVDRTVKLKTKPNNKSQTIATLVPEEEVWYIETGSHQWIYVEYTNDTTTTCGWVNKKYLRKPR
jgi:hypothetical protein